MKEYFKQDNGYEIASKYRFRKKVLYVIALFLFVLLLFYAKNILFTVDQGFDYHQNRNNMGHYSPPGRVLIILVDSLPLKYAFSSSMPFLESFRSKSAWGISKVVSSPFSIAGDHAIFAGKMSDFFSLVDDFKGVRVKFDNYFQRIHQQGSRLLILSTDCLQGAYGQYGGLSGLEQKHFRFKEYKEDAKFIFEKSYTILKKEKWDVAVVQFVSLDFIGHLETPKSANYPGMLKVMDEYIRKLISLTSRDDTVLVTSEHGMDDSGFHVDQSKDVLDTPFLLAGPDIVIGGPHSIFQIDIAPTLSFLSGVSPYYESPAIPAVEVINLPESKKVRLLKDFVNIISAGSNATTFEALRDIRQNKLTIKISLANKILIALVTLVIAMLLIFTVFAQGQFFPQVLYVYVPIAAVTIFFSILMISGLHPRLLQFISYQIPFSANFLIKHPVVLGFVFLSVFLVGRILSKNLNFKGYYFQRNEFMAFILYATMFGSVYNSSNPYSILNWIIIIIPLLAWGCTQGKAWFVIFAAIWIGLFIRRVSFVNVFSPIQLPGNWLFAILAFAGCLLYLMVQAAPQEKKRVLISGGVFFLPVFAVFMFFDNLTTRALLLLCCFLPFLIANRIAPQTTIVWLALWGILFLLGTSTRIEFLSHIAVLPILVVASLNRDSSVFVKGALLCMVIWILYFLPGNNFDLKLMEFTDYFIMSSVSNQQIGYVVSIIALRHILPVGVLFMIFRYSSKHPCSTIGISSIALLPVVLSLGTRFCLMGALQQQGVPWENIVRTVVLVGFALVIISAQLVSMGLVAFLPSNQERVRI